ncbi:MAG TPA: ABC transporter ATP-binding protein [Chthoniobacteraceae bacterium]|nr:ABC transporter ATP-binding protein [Chthoniobacteraceae bacterium]
MLDKQKNKLKQVVRDFRENKGVIADLLQYVKPYRVRFGLGILCGAIFNFINGLIILLVLFVSKVVFNTSSEINIAAMIPNLGPLNHTVQHLAVHVLHLDHISKLTGVIVACLLIPAVMMVRSVFDYLNNYLGIWVGNKVLLDVRAHLMRHITSQSMDYFNETRAGTLIQRVFNETLAIQGIFTMISQQISQPVAIVTGIFVLLRLNWLFTLGALVALPCVIGPVMALGKKIRNAALSEQLERGEMMVILHEMISGIKVIKSFARVQHEVNRFNDSSQTQFRQIMRVQRSIETVAPVVESLAAVGIAAGFFYAYLINMPGEILFALCGGIFMLYQPAKGLSRTHLNLVRSLATAKGVFELMRREPTVKDAPDAKVLTDCKGEIIFDDVSFGYKKDILAVEKINQRFEKGKYYALVGLSGSGKSTMLSLILRFYDPRAGSIRIDGHDLRELTQDSLRSQIGLVTQENFLFHESIFKNIAYGKLDATKEEVIAAAKQAYAHDFVMAQEKGYDTIVGDRGCQLSGGQVQRLSIARALLKNAPVLLLDEAMSALDSESEKQIQAALDTLIKGRTTIAIAHRLSTILKADEIVVLDGGHIVERGTCDELLEKGGHFRRLYDLQFDRPEMPELTVPA